jgi:hypothetical protein
MKIIGDDRERRASSKWVRKITIPTDHQLHEIFQVASLCPRPCQRSKGRPRRSASFSETIELGPRCISLGGSCPKDQATTRMDNLFEPAMIIRSLESFWRQDPVVGPHPVGASETHIKIEC